MEDSRNLPLNLLNPQHIASKPFIIPQYLHSRLCSLLENNGLAERDLDRPEYWKRRLSEGALSSLSASEEAVSLVFEVNSKT